AGEFVEQVFWESCGNPLNGGEPARGAPMPVACSLSTIALYAATERNPNNLNLDTVMLRIYKNNSPTSMTCTANATGLGAQVVSNTCTPGPVSFSVGDTLGMEWTHTKFGSSFSSLITQYGAGLRCE